jgi:hypothetical protein
VGIFGRAGRTPLVSRRGAGASAASAVCATEPDVEPLVDLAEPFVDPVDLVDPFVTPVVEPAVEPVVEPAVESALPVIESGVETVVAADAACSACALRSAATIRATRSVSAFRMCAFEPVGVSAPEPSETWLSVPSAMTALPCPRRGHDRWRPLSHMFPARPWACKPRTWREPGARDSRLSRRRACPGS